MEKTYLKHDKSAPTMYYHGIDTAVKGTGHFFETLSVGSVPGADHS